MCQRQVPIRQNCGTVGFAPNTDVRDGVQRFVDWYIGYYGRNGAYPVFADRRATCSAYPQAGGCHRCQAASIAAYFSCDVTQVRSNSLAFLGQSYNALPAIRCRYIFHNLFRRQKAQNAAEGWRQDNTAV